MQLQIVDMWSPDLMPPSSGLPEDPENFAVAIQVYLSEKGQNGGAVFNFNVWSPSAIANTYSGTFLLDTLVFDRFSWEAVRNRLEKLLLHCQSCKSWNEVILSLCGYLHYDD
jgi:hypothetical protein